MRHVYQQLPPSRSRVEEQPSTHHTIDRTIDQNSQSEIWLDPTSTSTVGTNTAYSLGSYSERTLRHSSFLFCVKSLNLQE